ncbi:TPA: hypothetical protein ACV7V6_005272, partial [Escherichia coli]
TAARPGCWLNNQSVRPVQWRPSGSAPQCTLLRIYTVYNDSDIVTRICRASGMEGGIPLFHMIPE